ncbi:hypothetical protein YC2023_086631 [Brassica napus]
MNRLPAATKPFDRSPKVTLSEDTSRMRHVLVKYSPSRLCSSLPHPTVSNYRIEITGEFFCVFTSGRNETMLDLVKFVDKGVQVKLTGKVCRGTAVMLVSPTNGTEEIANPVMLVSPTDGTAVMLVSPTEAITFPNCILWPFGVAVSSSPTPNVRHIHDSFSKNIPHRKIV